MGIVMIELTKKESKNKMPNEIEKVELKGVQKSQSDLVNELVASAESVGANFTDYGKKCIVNCYAGLVTTLRNQNKSITDVDPISLKIQLQNIGYTELNYAALPSEVYFDLREVTVKNKDGDDVKALSLAIKPQGAGNEKLVRRFGAGVRELGSAWLIREGDEFTLGSWNGDKQIPPTWVRKSLSGKLVAVVYPVKKNNGETEYLMADRESVKPNLIAMIRQNAMFSKDFYDVKTYTKENKKTGELETKEFSQLNKEKRNQFYAEVDAYFENKTLDEILRDDKYSKYINPTYTSGGSKEAMIERKMKNNALKKYPKEYDDSCIKDAVEDMFEEKDDTVLEKPFTPKPDVIENVESNLDNISEDAPQDFNVDDEENTTEEKTDTKIDIKDYDSII